MSDQSREQLARMIDHTLLRPEATNADLRAFLSEAAELGVYAVCVSPSMLPVADLPAGLKLATVCGFPSGAHTTPAKVAEAAESTALGADEVDMVVNLGWVKSGRFREVRGEIASVRREVALLKVIIESAALTDAEIVAACEAAAEAGADFVKTSTGFHPAGGASVEAVALMAATVPGLGVKASGGIKTYAQAVAMVDAGATRLGLSSTRAVLPPA